MRNFSVIAIPWYALVKKGAKFEWAKSCQLAFDDLKEKRVSHPILAFPMNVLDTYASDFGLDAVLSQEQPEGERVIAYTLCTISQAEQKYETTMKELLAILFD